MNEVHHAESAIQEDPQSLPSSDIQPIKHANHSATITTHSAARTRLHVGSRSSVHPSPHHKVEHVPAYVLHSHPYSETSLIIELMTREYGNLPVLAKGAKRPHSALRSTLLLFQPLWVTYSGKHEVRTLHKAEWAGGHAPLPSACLLSAYYLNELLLKLLPRDDAHPTLFDAYTDSLRALSLGDLPALVLRRFEQTLLRELGYAFSFAQDHEGNEIDCQAFYRVQSETGVQRVAEYLRAEEGVWSGHVLLALTHENFIDAATHAQARNLMRSLLARHLDGRRLKTRQILLDLQRYDI